MIDGHTYHSSKALEAWAQEHLRHEIVQLAAMTVTQVTDGLVMTPLRSSSWVGNALLESFLMHARGLDDFFGCDHETNRKQRRSRDVLAVDYLPSWSPRFRSTLMTGKASTGS